MQVYVTLITTIISVTVSALVSCLVVKMTSKVAEQRALETELSEILKIGIEHPLFERPSFTNAWTPRATEHNEQYAAYDLYATWVFNHLEKRCRFHKFRQEEVQKELDMRSWVALHKTYWKSPENRHEKVTGYDDRFRNIVDSIVGDPERRK